MHNIQSLASNCDGSGLILNADAISDQIIKVINEKISEHQNINVKCNTSLAETLINNKNKEITNLENANNSKITFIFDSQFSLHEPLVELENKFIAMKENSEVKKTRTKKKVERKKTKIKKKTSSKKINIENSNKSEEVIQKNIKKSKEEIKDIHNEESKIEEKTGWWS